MNLELVLSVGVLRVAWGWLVEGGSSSPTSDVVAWDVADVYGVALGLEAQGEDADAGAVLVGGHVQAGLLGLLVCGVDAEDNFVRVGLVCEFVQDGGEG